ncbi:hypothetical protein FGO68_gene12176 [Halteria grandinella]|uniref:Protein kinase domain-containing protein n=1 Tax=Halteria grandinella TaxID=5974 RepID=A0A8J8T0Q0_HALGN|nr:hypothetical protein FGO68_gene12176 [Halteria grandinella]
MLLHSNFIGFAEPLAKHVFTQLVQSIKELHSRGYAHLDIRHENLHFNANCNLILTNFINAEKPGKDGLTSCSKITMEYAPPEARQANKKQLNKYNAFKADIYQMGVVIYSAMTNVYPQFGEQSLMKKNLKELNLTDELSNLILKMISPNPEDRPTADEILADPWFSLTSHPCSSKLQIGPLEFKELIVYIREQDLQRVEVEDRLSDGAENSLIKVGEILCGKK